MKIPPGPFPHASIEDKSTHDQSALPVLQTHERGHFAGLLKNEFRTAVQHHRGAPYLGKFVPLKSSKSVAPCEGSRSYDRTTLKIGELPVRLQGKPRADLVARLDHDRRRKNYVTVARASGGRQPAGMLAGLTRQLAQATRQLPDSSLTVEDKQLVLRDLWRGIRRIEDDSHRSDALAAFAGLIPVLHACPMLREQVTTLVFTAATQTSRLSDEHRVRPLCALAGTLAHLPSEQKQEAFARLRQASEGLDVTHRRHLLTALAGQIGHFPAERYCRFEEVRAAVTQLPDQHKSAPLAALARQIEQLQLAEERQTAFDEMVSTIKALRADHGKPLATLTGQIRHLLPDERHTAFCKMRSTIEALPTDHRKPLAALAGQIQHLFPKERQTSFDEMFSTIKALPADHGKPLAALAGQIRHLSGDHREARFRDVLATINELPAEDRGEPLAALAREIAQAPDVDVGSRWFGKVSEAIHDVQPAHLPLAALAIVIQHIRPDHRQAAFDEVLARVKTLPAEHQGLPLAHLAGAIRTLSKDIQPPLLKDVRRQVKHLPLEERGAPLAVLGDSTRMFDPDSRWRWFKKVLRMISAIPGESRGQALAGLAAAILDLTEFERTTMFSRVLEAGEKLHDEHAKWLLIHLMRTFRMMSHIDRVAPSRRVRNRILSLPPRYHEDLLQRLNAAIAE